MKSEQLRILVLGDCRSVHLVRYVAQLQKQGCDVLIASLEDNDSAAEGEGASVQTYPLERRGRFDWLHYALSAQEIRRLVRKLRPDIVNPHFASGYGFAVALANARTHAPVVLHLWGSDILQVPRKSMLHRHKTIFGLRSTDLVVADSNYLLERCKALATLRNTMIIPWGMEREHLALHRANYAFGKPLRIIVPRMHEVIYNNGFLLQALAPLIRDKKVVMTFPSFGSLALEFKNAINQIDPLPNTGVRMYDRMPRTEFLEFMAQHDVYLSAAHSDSSPASLIESMGLGLIPIVADIPGVREWLTPEAGYRFKLNDSDSLYQLVRRLVESNDYHQEMRRNNLERVQAEGLFEDNIARLLEKMQTLVAERGSG